MNEPDGYAEDDDLEVDNDETDLLAHEIDDEADLETDGKAVVLSAVWECWPAASGEGEWLCHLDDDPDQLYLARVEVFAPPGAPLSEQPYSDELREWRRATWPSLESFIAQERPEGGEAETCTLDEVKQAVTPDLYAWMAEALQAHADALEELAASQRRRPEQRFHDYARENKALARDRKSEAAQLIDDQSSRELLGQRDATFRNSDVASLLADRIVGSTAQGKDLEEVTGDLLDQMKLLAQWNGSDRETVEQLAAAAADVARRRQDLLQSKSWTWAAPARWLATRVTERPRPHPVVRARERLRLRVSER